MRCPASAYAISASTCPLYAWSAFLNDKAAARRHLEVEQRIRICHSRPIRDYEHDAGPSPRSAPSAKLRACYILRILSVRYSWDRGDDIATVQCRHSRRVRAILHRNRFPTYRRNVSVYAHYFDRSEE